MSTFPGSPIPIKGALVGFDLFQPVPAVIPFQFNPASVQRTLKPRAAGGGGEQGGGGATAEAMRLSGAPEETIKLEAEFDAVDAMVNGELPSDLGLYPQLSALEMLVYPKSALVITNTVLLAAGTIEIVPPAGPLTLFVWGLGRILPVRPVEFGITEEAYDSNLNPIRAKVSLGLRVLTYNDLSITNPAYYVFLAHQVAKEAIAVAGSIGNLSEVVGGDVKLF